MNYHLLYFICNPINNDIITCYACILKCLIFINGDVKNNREQMEELLIYFKLISRRTPITAHFMQDLCENSTTVWFEEEDAMELYAIFTNTIGKYIVRDVYYEPTSFIYSMPYENYEILLELFKIIHREIIVYSNDYKHLTFKDLMQYA